MRLLQTRLGVADDADCSKVHEGVVSGSNVRFVVSESGTLVSAKAFGPRMAA
jgi:hypothetical protein